MNIVDPFLFHAKLNPAAPAICVPGAAQELVSYGRLVGLINNVGKTALAWGLARGQVVAIHVQDKIFHAALILGLARLGIVTVSARNLNIPKELGAAAVIADATLAYRNVGRVIVADPASWMMSGDGKPLADARLYQVGGADPCRITLTSGTTGEPRGIPFTHDLVFSRNARLAYTRDQAFQLCSRFYCDLGFATDPGYRDLFRMLSKGGTIFYYGGDAETLMQAFELYKVEGMVASPEGLAQHLKFYEAYPEAPCGLDHILTSGASLPRSLSMRVRARMCTNLSCTYGATETGGIALGPARVIADSPGAAGFVTPGAEAEIVDDAGHVLPTGREGLVRIRTPQTVAGYVGDPPENKTAFRAGWFYPGDIGSLRADGLLIILGRDKTVLNLGGDKVRPEAVEDVLTAFPGIEQAGVFTRINEFGNAELWAAIVARAQFDEGALRRHCQERLGASFAPVRFVPVDQLPRGAGGKLNRTDLAGIVPSDGS